MGHTPHELADDFPELAQRIHELKLVDPHFARQLDEYHALNREIHRAETRVDTITEEAEHELRKTRMALKDALYHRLSDTVSGA